MATIGRIPRARAFDTTNLVWGIGPSAASTRTMAPSTMLRMRSTSPPKSAWPGVSTMLMRVSFQTTEAAFDKIVMPRSRSRSFESITRSATRWLSRKAPDCCRRRSTSVVLPWSTCAMIATLRSAMFLESRPTHVRAGCRPRYKRDAAKNEERKAHGGQSRPRFSGLIVREAYYIVALLSSGDDAMAEAEPITFLILDVARMIRQRFEDELGVAGLGITAGEARTLLWAGRSPGLRQTALAEKL